MAVKPHAVRNGYIALKDVDDANLKCWTGDVLDIPPRLVDTYVRRGVIAPDVRPAGYGAEPLPKERPQVVPPVAESEPEPEPSPSVPDLPPAEPELALADDGAGTDWRDTVHTSAPAAPRKRGRPRKDQSADPATDLPDTEE